MAAAALVGNVRQAFFIDGRLVATDEIRLSDGHPLIGVRIDDLRERESALVIDVQRNGETLLLPDLDLCLASGDHVTLLAPIESIQRIRNRGMRTGN